MIQKWEKMPRFMHGFASILLLTLFLTGCVGMRPAVKPPPPAAEVQAEDSKEDEQQTSTPAPMEEEIQEEATIEEIETAEESVQLNDDLDLPSSAMPVGVLPMAVIPMIPNDGPAPKGEEPANLIDGWKVQIISAPTIDTIQQVQNELSKITGEKTHIHWQNSSYVLVVGNYNERVDAESLKEKMILHGYEHAAVIKSPIVAEVPVPEVAPVEENNSASEEILYGWRIQVMSLADRASARAERSKVENITGLKAYIEEVSGSFKIRVGNFKDKNDALEAKKRVVESGFEGVFPVETRIENE